jgi:hypothetical protein
MRLLTAKVDSQLATPICHDDTRIKLGKEWGANAERLCSSYEAPFPLEKLRQPSSAMPEVLPKWCRPVQSNAVPWPELEKNDREMR